MHKTVEALLDPSGAVRFLEPVTVASPTKILVTILDAPDDWSDALLLAEPSLSDWLRQEEDEAWQALQPVT